MIYEIPIIPRLTIQCKVEADSLNEAVRLANEMFKINEVKDDNGVTIGIMVGCNQFVSYVEHEAVSNHGADNEYTKEEEIEISEAPYIPAYKKREETV